ncbi:MAG: BamA/TamA family outer membrane protein, partial [Candidatus Cloacimonetes bacterium]|nr:BamA/TamA family outer membrane protein [Candidatus Cloacimonadota bacterium]
TDIETGKPVILDHGYLPEAVRASMSIPSMFTPVEIEGKLLVDGGLARNFPVSDCRALGADYIIGVDVSTGLQSREELNSLVKIMEQSIGFYGEQSLRESRELTDLLITPQVGEYSITDFSDADSLIAIGERAARKQEVMLGALSQMVNRVSPPKVRKPKPDDAIYLSKINFHGLKKVSKNLIIGKIRLREQTTVTNREIDNAITKLFGSRYFNRVTYSLIPDDKGYILDVTVEEKKTSLFKAGLHYDSDMKASVMLNTTFRNIFVQGSKLSIDLKLGDNNSFRWSEFVHTGLRPGFGLRWDLLYDRFDFIYRSPEGVKIASLNIENGSSTMHFMTIFSDNFALGTAVDAVLVATSGEIIPEEWGELDDKSYWLRNSVYLKLDTRDKAYYPKRGSFLYLETKWFNGKVSQSIYDNHFLRVFLDGEKIIPLSKKTSIALGGFVGFTDTNNIPVEEAYYLGGFTDKDNGRPFVGFNFAEVPAEEVYMLRSRIQYEPWEGKYFILRFDSGRVVRDFIMQKAEDFWMNGWGLSFGMETPIGPIEITTMGNDQNDDNDRTYINIGYVF